MFESISLSSTISKAEARVSNVNTNGITSRDPINDDEELDPTEFLSPGSPGALRVDNSEGIDNSVESVDNSVESVDESVDNNDVDDIHDEDDPFESTLKESITLTGSFGGFESPRPDDSPLQFLQQQHNQLLSSLQTAIKSHDRALNKGSSKLNHIRNHISRLFGQISENQYALNELYIKEAGYNETMLAKFKAWDGKRNKILNKIKLVKSDSNNYGVKLTSLLDESSAIDEEIDELEIKLQSLKAKKLTLNSEIQHTSSVLESRTSKYVKSFQELDKNGEMAIVNHLRLNGLSDEKVNTLVHKTKVNVSFGDNYKLRSRSSERVEKTSPNTPQTSQTSLKLTPSKSSVKSPKLPTMGMQAYEVPTETPTQPHTQPPTQPPTQQPSQPPHSPYDKGYYKGHRQSEKVKQTITRMIDNYMNPSPYAPPLVKVDDETNTITQKIDLDPILTFLVHQVDAYKEMIRRTGEETTQFHNYFTIWKDICTLLMSQEQDLLTSLSQSKDPEDFILNNILGVLNNIYTIVNNQTSKGNTPLILVINDELTALLTGLSMLKTDHSDKIQPLKTKFHSIGLLQEPNTDTISSKPNYSFSNADYLYNISANAIEHKMIPEVEQLSPAIRLSSSKLFKGE